MGKVYLRTFGCQMNEYDSEKISDVLRAAEGLEPAERPEDADLIVFNTCSVREKAQEKVFADLGRVKHLKREKPGLMIAVGGCVASQEGGSIVERAPYVDVVFGPQTLHRLPQLLERRRATGRPQVDVSFPEIEKFDHLPPPRVQGAQAFVSIMEGCSKYCSFCVVPYTRGEEVSRRFDDVLTEVAGLTDQGVKEITLLGQNVNAYRGAMSDGAIADFAMLLEYLAEMPGLERIRYTTSHPKEFNQRLIDMHAQLPQLVSHVHLPVQSGSDRILRAMNRSHTAETYLATIEKMRDARPDIALSGDFIVGFSGETEEDFEATLQIVDTVGYASAYSFKYSARPGTPAATMEDQIPREVMDDRLQRLQGRINAHQLAFNRSKVGVETQILIERAGKYPGQMIGRTPWLQSVHVETDAKAGDLLDVTLISAGPNSMTGAVRQKEVA